MNTSTRKLLGQPRQEEPTCKGSGAWFEAVNPHLPRGEVQCGTCGRRFNVRVIRTHRGVMVNPRVTVPGHRPSQPEENGS